MTLRTLQTLLTGEPREQSTQSRTRAVADLAGLSQLLLPWRVTTPFSQVSSSLCLSRSSSTAIMARLDAMEVISQLLSLTSRLMVRRPSLTTHIPQSTRNATMLPPKVK